MKWWEYVEDLGDGTQRVRRYRTEKAARDAFAIAQEGEWAWEDPEEVDTESGRFFQEDHS